MSQRKRGGERHATTAAEVVMPRRANAGLVIGCIAVGCAALWLAAEHSDSIAGFASVTAAVAVEVSDLDDDILPPVEALCRAPAVDAREAAALTAVVARAASSMEDVDMVGIAAQSAATAERIAALLRCLVGNLRGYSGGLQRTHADAAFEAGSRLAFAIADLCLAADDADQHLAAVMAAAELQGTWAAAASADPEGLASTTARLRRAALLEEAIALRPLETSLRVTYAATLVGLGRWQAARSVLSAAEGKGVAELRGAIAVLRAFVERHDAAAAEEDVATAKAFDFAAALSDPRLATRRFTVLPDFEVPVIPADVLQLLRTGPSLPS
jgi:hypothetical protein